jgi:O-antigen/teichoic acid export membrane protein
MGIVFNQSFKNTISTYLGFGIGAINTLFLYTNFLSDTYYGLVAFVLSTSNIMMPFMAFGVHNAIVKFYSGYTSQLELNAFLSLMLVLPLLVILPVGLTGYLCYDTIAKALASQNIIVQDYIWHMFIIAVAMAYFEIFYAWAKVQLKTVFGTVMKEIFHRVLIMVLLAMVYFQWITAHEFIHALVLVYILRMIIMKLRAYMLRRPVLVFRRIQNIRQVLIYAVLMIVAGSIAMIILDIDKFMIGIMLEHIENVAYYSVAIFIATVIAVPQRAMHQIMMPLTAQYLNTRDFRSLRNLYQRSSLNLLVVSGFIFLLIILNINELYEIFT